jgi:predicted deacylase
MITETLTLAAYSPGTTQTLNLLRFGMPGARPKAYLQAALHADELPGVLVLAHLRRELESLEAAGRLRGEVVLVPTANPVGLAQHVLGEHVGRFALAEGGNFNRGYAALADAAAARVAALLGDSAEDNVAAVRAALRAELAAQAPIKPVAQLKRALLAEAIDADLVLDLHCDSQAVLHLYTLTPQAAAFEPLARLMGAQAVLLATDSGDNPFDEACSQVWLDLGRRFPGHPLPLACDAATIELRGETDVDHRLAQQDARALLGFLTLRGHVDGPTPELPPALCEPTPLSGSEPIVAPRPGVIVFHRAPGDRVAAGDAIADIVDPASGAVTTLHTTTSGVMYARCSTRLATPGTRLAKVAGTSLRRSGKLLSE